MSSDPTQSNSDVSQTSHESPELTASSSASSNSPSAQDGPLNLEKIRAMRQALEQSQAPKPQRPDRPKKQKSLTAKRSDNEDSQNATDQGSTVVSSDEQASVDEGRTKQDRSKNRDKSPADTNRFVAPKISVPTARTPLSDDQISELEDAIRDADLDALMIGDKSLQVGRRLEEGQRYPAKVLKIHSDNVFFSLGGPDEGVVPLLQFTDMPQVGQQIDCIVRGFDESEGLYLLAIPGEAITVEDWSDLENGAVVEAKIESANTGGLECKVGSIRGFIPMSQISEYRIEDASSYVGQTLTCVITEANPRRGNLVLSHRAILEREKQAKKAERLSSIQIGDMLEGTVRKVTDFGAFVDLGGLDGLIHISQLSWEKVKHPSEVVNEGDKVKVRIEKVDAETGKIGLSYRSMQEHPWANIDSRFPIGSIVKGTVSRIAAFGVFVKVAPGIEGLVHVSEIAHRRISTPSSVVQEGQEVEVKVLSADRESQRMSLSIKQAQAVPVQESNTTKEKDEVEEPIRKPAVSKYKGPLKGGVGTGSGGEQFGLKW